MILCFQVIDPKGEVFDKYIVNCVNKFNSVKTYYNDETVFNYDDFNFRLKPDDLQQVHKVLHNKQYPELAKENLIKLSSNSGVIIEIKKIILNEMTQFKNKLIEDSYSVPTYISFVATESLFVRHYLELFLTAELTIQFKFEHVTPNNYKYVLDMTFTDKEFSEFEKLW